MSASETIAALLNHRTIREFTSEPVDEQTIHTLFDVAMRTSTSMGMQNTSIIWVKDPQKRRRLAQINEQAYVAEAPVYLLFIVDVHRIQGIFHERGVDDLPLRTMDLYTAAFTDACLQVQNVVAAAESLGLGATILGGVLNNPPAVIEILNLPELTFPVLGLILGHPAQNPALKPRMPQDLRVMIDEYQEPESWCNALSDYDREMCTYYDLRNAGKHEPPFTDQAIAKYGRVKLQRARILDDLTQQGFIPDSSKLV